MKLRLLVLCLLGTLLQACVSPILDPQTFRERISGSMFGYTKEFQSNKPFSVVVANLKTQSAKCLNKTLQKTQTSGGSWQGGMYMAGGTSTITYTTKSSVSVQGKTASLVAQEKNNGGSIEVVKAPPDGNYIVVVDVTDNGKTGVTAKLYGIRAGFDPLNDIIPKWIDGESKMCPELH